MKSAFATNGFLPATAPEHRTTLAIGFSWGSNYMPPPSEPPFPPPSPLLIAQVIRERKMLITGGMGPSTDTDKQIYLQEQMADDLYFVVASAYDYEQLARGNRKLVWRTTMTVSAMGVAMTESLSPLIASAAPFFGREMTEPQLTSKHIYRDGKVEIGPLQVVDIPPPGTKAPTSTEPAPRTP